MTCSSLGVHLLYILSNFMMPLLYSHLCWFNCLNPFLRIPLIFLLNFLNPKNVNKMKVIQAQFDFECNTWIWLLHGWDGQRNRNNQCVNAGINVLVFNTNRCLTDQVVFCVFWPREQTAPLPLTVVDALFFSLNYWCLAQHHSMFPNSKIHPTPQLNDD